MITIFANMRINEESRLKHLKDSLQTFKDLSDNWVINVRGKLRDRAIQHLQQELGDKLVLFNLLDDKRGWIPNARKMLPAVKYNYLLIWLEDHLNIAPIQMLRSSIDEMEKHRADYMQYSWWVFGEQRRGLEKLEYKKGQYIDSVLLTPEKWQTMLEAGNKNYLISLLGIFKKDLFAKLLDKDEHKLPLSWKRYLYSFMTLLNRLGWKFDHKKGFNLINKLAFNKFRRFTYEAPFDLEKGPTRTDVLPLVVSFPKQELFACIDDDLGVPGYQLIKRGFYPFPELPKKFNSNEIDLNKDDFKVKRLVLQPGESYGSVYFEEKNRIPEVLMEYLYVEKGKVQFQNGAGFLEVSQGESISYPTNTPHNIKALSDSNLMVYEAKI